VDAHVGSSDRCGSSSTKEPGRRVVIRAPIASRFVRRWGGRKGKGNPLIEFANIFFVYQQAGWSVHVQVR